MGCGFSVVGDVGIDYYRVAVRGPGGGWPLLAPSKEGRGGPVMKGFGLGLTAATLPCFASCPRGAVAQELGTGTWSGTIEISNQLDRSFKIRYDSDPESANRTQGASTHTLSYQIELSATRGTPEFELYSGGVPNAALTEFSWVGGGFADGADPSTCDYTGLGSADYPADPGCLSPSDRRARAGGVRQRRDDDGDGNVDSPADNDCPDPTGESEMSALRRRHDREPGLHDP